MDKSTPFTHPPDVGPTARVLTRRLDNALEKIKRLEREKRKLEEQVNIFKSRVQYLEDLLDREDEEDLWAK